MKELVAILGAGESGRGAAILAKKVGHRVFVSDSNKISKQTKLLFWKLSIDYEENHHSIEKILKAEKIIKSPGIDKNSDLIAKIKKKGYWYHIRNWVWFSANWFKNYRSDRKQW